MSSVDDDGKCHLEGPLACPVSEIADIDRLNLGPIDYIDTTI